MIFQDFDFDALDLPTYKEDAVREDIIAPILKKVGYGATGDNRIVRSKSLVHPFVKIGSKDQPIRIVPDYTLYWKEIPLLVLDAKSPSEEVVKSRHVEQAFSYAIHPDIKAPYYGLCNGRHLVVRSWWNWDPLLLIPIQEVDARWKEVHEALHPKFLLRPDLKGFRPDYGMTMLKAGFRRDLVIFNYGFYWIDIARAEDGLYTSTSTCRHGDIVCIVSFDYDESIFQQLIAKLPMNVKTMIQESLRRQPYTVELGGKVIVCSVGQFGELTRGQHEEFVPVKVIELKDVSYDPTVVLDEDL